MVDEGFEDFGEKIGGALGGLFESGKEATSDILDSAGEYFEDGAEALGYRDDFSTIDDVNDYFRNGDGRLVSELGAFDLFDSEKAGKKVDAANAEVVRLVAALHRINSSGADGKEKIRFSRDYIGKEVAEMDNRLAKLDGGMVNLLHLVAKTGAFSELSISIKQLEVSVRAARTGVNNLIDDNLKEDCSNTIVNYLLSVRSKKDEAEDYIGDKKRDVDRIAKVAKVFGEISDLL